MTYARTIANLSVIAVLALSGCGSGGEDPSEHVANTSTLTGNVARHSVDLTMRTQTPAPRWYDVWSPVRRAFAATRQARVTVNDFATQADDNGFFILEGLPAGTVTVQFEIGGTDFSFELTLPAGTIVSLQDVVLANGRGKPTRIVIKGRPEAKPPTVGFRATVVTLACPDSITVARTDGESIVVRLAGSTELDGVAACDDLLDRQIDIEGTPERDDVLADDIEIHES